VALTVAVSSACSSDEADQSSVDPCEWLTVQDVQSIVDRSVEEGGSEPLFPLCTYAYTSDTGVRTDVVVGPWDEGLGSVSDFNPPNHERQEINGLGESATFWKAKTIDDGNSMLVVKDKGRTLFVGGEFIQRGEATELARLALANWS
jgi:hypothetical protein